MANQNFPKGDKRQPANSNAENQVLVSSSTRLSKGIIMAIPNNNIGAEADPLFSANQRIALRSKMKSYKSSETAKVVVMYVVPQPEYFDVSVEVWHQGIKAKHVKLAYNKNSGSTYKNKGNKHSTNKDEKHSDKISARAYKKLIHRVLPKLSELERFEILLFTVIDFLGFGDDVITGLEKLTKDGPKAILAVNIGGELKFDVV